MDSFKTSYGIKVTFTPWFSSGWRFTKLTLKEELGGEIASGTIDLITDRSNGALDVLKNEKKGQLKLEDDWGESLTIPVLIIDKHHTNNYLTLKFLCGITSSEFFDINKTQIHEKPIKEVIKSLYPGKVDIRPDCETDLQKDPPPPYYQDQETNWNYCTKLCMAYKKDCIFTYGWEGLMVKDTFGNKNSHGQHDSVAKDQMRITVDSAHVSQRDDMRRPLLKPSLYDFPVNLWEDTEQKVAIKDYTDWEPINFRCMAKMDERYIMHKDYYQLDYNFSYNREYQESTFYNQITITNRDIPKYRIGDAVYVKNAPMIAEKSYDLWDWKWYLVKENEIFLAIDDAGYLDEDGQLFGWTSKLVAYEEDGSWKYGTENDTLEGV